MARILPFIFIVWLLLPPAVWADPSSEEAATYYQYLKKAPADVNAAGLVFGEKLREALATASAEHVAQMKIAFVDILVAMHRIQLDVKALKENPSPVGKKLRETVDNYLKQQEKTIFDTGPEIIRIAADGALSLGDKRAKIQEIVEGNRKSAAAVEGPFTTALLEFAREHELPGENTVEFRDFTPPDKACKVQIPDLTENKASETNGVKNSYFLCEHKQGLFMLTYADITASREDENAAQKRLDEARSGVVKKLNLKISKETPQVLEGKYPGREIEGELPDATKTRIRLYMVNGRLYQMWIVGKPTWAMSAEATRFLTSLEIAK